VGQRDNECWPHSHYSDPSDVAGIDKHVIESPKRGDVEAERERPANKRKAQEWANIEIDPNAELMVFVGRWSKQKGVDLIADAMVSL
jgi:alpha-1,3-glucan synthase